MSGKKGCRLMWVTSCLWTNLLTCPTTSAFYTVTRSSQKREISLSTTSAQYMDIFETSGFTQLPCSVDSCLLAPARTAVQERLDMLLTAASEAGCDPEDTAFNFQEICHRQQYRYDLSFELDDDVESTPEAWRSLINVAVQKASHFLMKGQIENGQHLQPRVIMSGAVVSRPGAKMQTFHVDGKEEGLYTLFIPLVDVKPDSDGTQFWPGSHLMDSTEALAHAKRMQEQHTAATGDNHKEEEESEEMSVSSTMHLQSPGCAAGDLLLFDYRVVHRGRPNITTRERPMAYVVLATCPNAWDAHNFSRVSVFDVLPIQVEQMDRFQDWL